MTAFEYWQYKGVGMKSKLVKLSEKPFIRNVLILTTGTAAAQAVTMALSPIITRLYGPDEFGLLGMFTAVVGIITPIAALTYPIAIVLPKSDKEAKGLIRLSLSASVFISLVVALLLTLFNQDIIRVFNLERISPYLYLIPIFILFTGLLEVTEQWLIRTKQFRLNANVSFYQAVILQSSKVGVGFFYPVAAMLITLTVFGQFLKTVMYIKSAKKSNYKHIYSEADNDENFPIIDLARKYKDFPVYRAPQSFIFALSQSLPILLLASFFGPISAGFYSLGRSVMGIPTSLIGKSIGDVFYPRISEAANNGENLTSLIKKTILVLAVVGIIPFGIVIVFGPSLFSLVFGLEWVKAGEYARWIALGLFFTFIYQPCIKVFPVLSLQAFHLKFTFITLLINMLALTTGYYMFSNDLIAITFLGISTAILNILLIILTLRLTKKFDES